MAFTIVADCISCGACADACPADAINSGDNKFEIDQNACIQCGACVDTCPTNAIIDE